MMISDYVLWYVLTASGFGCKHGWLVLRVRGVRDNFETVFGAYIETTGMLLPEIFRICIYIRIEQVPSLRCATV